MSQHTPGTWFVIKDEHPRIMADSPNGLWAIAVVVPEAGTEDVDDTQGNARLIASAPDLLQAAQAFLSGKEAHPTMLRLAVERATGRPWPWRERDA